MRTQIRTLQVRAHGGAGAFVVVPAGQSTAEFNGQNLVTGAPGTVGVQSPRPAALRDDSWGGLWQPSSVAPNAILPSIYVAHANGSMRFPGDLYRNHVGPVPATNQGNLVKIAWSQPRIGGDRVTRALRPFTQWKTYGKGAK